MRDYWELETIPKYQRSIYFTWEKENEMK